MNIRECTSSDLPQILGLLNHEIEHGVAHFGETPLQFDELRAQFDERGQHPWLVAAEDEEVCGLTKSARMKPRDAYRWTVEVSIYLCAGAQGKGLGKRLYSVLFDELERRGFRRVVAGTTLPNPASERLHESCGMRVIGTQQRVGFKHGRWRDVRYYQLDLPRGTDPEMPPTREPGT